MPERDGTYRQSYSSANADEERDMGAKGGPTTSLGIADNAHDVSHPYNDDTQTQLAAKSTLHQKHQQQNKDCNKEMGNS